MSQKTSIFGAWVRQTFGSKALLMAILQSGPNLMPSGAPEHARDFSGPEERALRCLEELVAWLARFADALVEHRNKDPTQEARRRSGVQRGQSGLTQEEHEQRTRRDKAQLRLREAWQVQTKLNAYKNYDYSRFSSPRSWKWLHRWERQAVTALQNGALQQELEAARAAHGGRVQAPPFRLHD